MASEMRAVLLGVTGNGKSTTGNKILRKDVFKTSGGSISQTRECQKSDITRNGWSMRLVDTPGLLDTDLDFETIQTILTPFLDMTFPGPHVIFYVIKAGKFTPENKNGLEMLLQMFGRSIFDYTIFVFTHLSSDCSPEMYKSSFPSDLKRYIDMSRNRCVFLPNPANSTEMEAKVNELVTMAGNLVSSNSRKHYTNEMYKAHQNVVNERKEKERQRLAKENEEKQKAMAAKIEEDNRREMAELRAKAEADRRAAEEQQRQLNEIRRQEEERARQQADLKRRQEEQQREIARLEAESRPRKRRRNDCVVS